MAQVGSRSAGLGVSRVANFRVAYLTRMQSELSDLKNAGKLGDPGVLRPTAPGPDGTWFEPSRPRGRPLVLEPPLGGEILGGVQSSTVLARSRSARPIPSEAGRLFALRQRDRLGAEDVQVF